MTQGRNRVLVALGLVVAAAWLRVFGAQGLSSWRYLYAIPQVALVMVVAYKRTVLSAVFVVVLGGLGIVTTFVALVTGHELSMWSWAAVLLDVLGCVLAVLACARTSDEPPAAAQV